MFKLYIGLAFCVITLGTGISTYFISSDSLSPNNFYNKILTVTCYTSVVMWIWMMSDYFKRADIKHKVFWGWILVLFNLIAGLIYFMFVYFPNERLRLRQSEDVG